MAGHTPTIERARRARPETSAWLILVGFFFVFCSIVAAACVAGWRYYTNATTPVSGAQVVVHAPAGVNYQAKGQADLTTPNKPCGTSFCQPVSEGDRVQARPEAGYGPVASIVLADNTRVADMYAYPTGADLTLEQYRVSRWTGERQEIQFRQTAGYVRYDIPDKLGMPYDQVSYQVAITSGVAIDLSPGGSYSIDVPHYDERHPPDGPPLIAEVAVRAGSAEVRAPGGSVTARPGEKVRVDAAGAAGAPMRAEWQLIRAGDFSCETVQNDHCGPWQRISHIFDPTVTPDEQKAAFTVYRGCRPETPAFCTEDQTTNIAQFFREGDHSKSYGVGISQTLDLDISEYRSLKFSMTTRVIKQSIQNAGIANIECPVTVELWYKQDSPSDAEQKRSICVYKDDSDDTSVTSQLSEQLPGGWVYQGVRQNLWHKIEFNLRDDDLLPDARYLQLIRIYANGHDYISEVTDISLVATQ
jgi:hypothetical protein